MISKIVEEIEEALKQGNFKKGIDLMRNWLATCQSGEPAQLLQASSPKMRPNVTLLMRDVMSRYPNTLVGCPLLVYCTAEGNSDLLVSTRGMVLPFPGPKNAKPCSDLHFVGWLPFDTQLPVRLPFTPAQYEVTADWCTPTAYVALFRMHAGILHLDEMTVPPEWWADVFGQDTRNDQVGDVRIEGSLMFHYPDAIEVATALQAGAMGAALPVAGPFQHELNWAYDMGVVFVENCRTQFIGSAF